MDISIQVWVRKLGLLPKLIGQPNAFLKYDSIALNEYRNRQSQMHGSRKGEGEALIHNYSR